MILPTKVVKPIDSLYCISAYVIQLLSKYEAIDFDDLFDELNAIYPKNVSLERLQQCLDFLFIIGKLELEDETFKIIFR
ncbi:ABC-three component system middle component 6 [Shewanella frigidimarina]|uniref:ABC-three component system middle component 6 n=1 Tax=Shewanella frigidimarina TaxID=56812 RepID=UPI00317786B1